MKRQRVLLVWNEAYSKALFQRLGEERRAEDQAAAAVKREIERARAEERAEQENNGKGGRS